MMFVYTLWIRYVRVYDTLRGLYPAYVSYKDYASHAGCVYSPQHTVRHKLAWLTCLPDNEIYGHLTA